MSIMLEGRHCVFFPGDTRKQISIEDHHRTIMERSPHLKDMISQGILSSEEIRSIAEAARPRRSSFSALDPVSTTAPPLLIKKPVKARPPVPRPAIVLTSFAARKVRRPETSRLLSQLPPLHGRLGTPSAPRVIRAY